MTSWAAYGLLYAAQDFLASNPSQGKIAANDRSLLFSGRYDLNGNWTGSHHNHEGHNRGTAADVRANRALYSLPSSKIAEFMQFCSQRGASLTLHEGVGTSNEHVHCEWPNP
jgi:hypothetical protein